MAALDSGVGGDPAEEAVGVVCVGVVHEHRHDGSPPERPVMAVLEGPRVVLGHQRRHILRPHQPADHSLSRQPAPAGGLQPRGQRGRQADPPQDTHPRAATACPPRPLGPAASRRVSTRRAAAHRAGGRRSDTERRRTSRRRPAHRASRQSRGCGRAATGPPRSASSRTAAGPASARCGARRGQHVAAGEWHEPQRQAAEAAVASIRGVSSTPCSSREGDRRVACAGAPPRVPARRPRAAESRPPLTQMPGRAAPSRARATAPNVASRNASASSPRLAGSRRETRVASRRAQLRRAGGEFEQLAGAQLAQPGEQGPPVRQAAPLHPLYEREAVGRRCARQQLEHVGLVLAEHRLPVAAAVAERARPRRSRVTHALAPSLMKAT